MHNQFSRVIVGVFILSFWLPSIAQPPLKYTPKTFLPKLVIPADQLKFKHSKFTFARIKHSATPGIQRRPSSLRWSIDYPDADLNLSAQFTKVTGLQSDPKGVVIEFTDPRIKSYPFIYAIGDSGIQLTEHEITNLRDYLNRGGLLMIDDFWGEPSWASISEEFKKVFPNRKPIDVPLSHPIFQTPYRLTEKPQVPNVNTGVASEKTGVTWERTDGKTPHYRGIVDDDGRLMVLFCHNTDLGDGWERPDVSPYYYQEFCLKKAYPLGINIVVHALTR